MKMPFREDTLPARSTVRAVVRLLADANPRVTEACRQKLFEWGETAMPLLREATSHDDPRLRLRARSILRSLELRDWVSAVRRFAVALRRRSKTSGAESNMLEEGALLLSSVSQSIDAAAVRRQLDELGHELGTRVTGRTATSSARILGSYLAGKRSFDGDHSSYYARENVVLDEVLNGHKGIPVSLSILYILVGRRAGLVLTGVEMPDHFLVRVHGARPVLVDPFHGGRTITRADCVRYLRTMGYSQSMSSLLEDQGDLQILASLLAGLQRVYGYREDREAVAALERARSYLQA